MPGDISIAAGRLERAKLATKLAGGALAISFGLELLATLCGPVYEWASLDLYWLAILPFGFATLFALAALIHASIEAKAALEDEERALLEKRKESSTSILNVSEDVRFTAGRSLANLEKYAPPLLSLLGFIASAAALYLFWRQWGARVQAPIPANPLNVAFVSALCMVFSVFPGAFLVGQSQVREFRWLRPVGAWLVAGFSVMLLASVSALLIKFGIYGWERVLARVAYGVLALLGAEFLVSFVTEFYRPRTQAEDRPVFESRLLALFTEPGGVMRNVADTLDYQFGFKVSKTWIYNFVERSIVPALIAWLAALWLFTGIAEVGPGELGLRERFGALAGDGKPLHPGVHFKLPWPFERIIRVPVDMVQEVIVGASLMDAQGKETKPEVVLWTAQHYAKEGGFLVANEKKESKGEGKAKDISTAVSILDATLPVHYKVKPDSLCDYAFKFESVARTIKNVGEREASKYFASTDFLKDMSSAREEVAKAMKERMQSAVDALGLGVDIVRVNFHDAHPPIEDVAPAFQDVLTAQEQKEAMILDADAYKVRTLAEAEIARYAAVMEAESYKYNAVIVSAAEASRFKRQLAAYKAMPSMYRLRTYLEFLESDCKDRRKFIVSTGIPYQIYEINLEEKARLDLLDADLGELSKP